MNMICPSIIEVAQMFAKTHRILLVEDHEGLVCYMRHVIEGFDVALDVAGDRAEVEASLHGTSYDLVMLDLVISDISRCDLIRLVADKSQCPVMVFSGNIDPQIQQVAISILDRPIWFVEKPAMFTPERFQRLFQFFNLNVFRHG